MVTREEALAALKSLQVADVFLQACQEKSLPYDLNFHFGAPEEFFLAPDSQDYYTKGRLIPLLDDGNFDAVTFLDPDSRHLIQMYVEAPEESPKVFTSWQQYQADLFIDLAEARIADGEEEQLAPIADVIGFQHMDKTVQFVRSRLENENDEDNWDEDEDENEWDKARLQFIASI